MNQSFRLLCCTLAFLASYTSFAMDFDAEEGMPLEEIPQRVAAQKVYQKAIAGPIAPPKKNSTIINQIPPQATIEKPITPQSIDEKFIAFEQKVLDEFGGINGHPRKKKLTDYDYLELAQRDIPQMFLDIETIKKCVLIEKTFFRKVIEQYQTEILKHYKNVTSDTLASINNPHYNQPISHFNDLPLGFKKYIMDCAYLAVSPIPYKCIEFSKNCRYIDFHDIPELAIAAHDQEFHIWNLKTGNYTVLAKKAVHGATKFSNDGKLFITVTLHQKTPKKIIHLDIWDSFTQEHIRNISSSRSIRSVILENKPSGDKSVWIFDEKNGLTLFILKADGSCMKQKTVTNIEKFYDCSHNIIKRGNYELSGHTLSNTCIAYAFCLQAIKNTTKKDSLPNIKIAPLYEKLTPLEKDLIEQEMIQKAQNLIKK